MTMAKIKTVTDEFQAHLGAYEYNDFVKKMIRWYYGYDAQVAWCAISMSYMMNQLGLLNQIGGKNQNCYEMLCDIKAAVKKTKKGTLKLRGENLKKGDVIPRGAIIFILRDDPPMTHGSKKHVTSCYTEFTYKGTGVYEGLGGNQDPENGKPDQICVKKYTQAKIWAIFMPEYSQEKTEHPTLRQGDKGTEVKKMQNDLRKIGFSNITGKEMVADGSFGRITANTVVSFQVLNNLKADGVCGPKTWGKIDELLAMPKRTSVAQTRVNVRTGPGTGFPMIDKTYDESGKLIRGNVVDEGEKVTYTVVLDGWLFLPTYNGWSRSKWYNL